MGKPREGEDRAVEREGEREVRIEGTEQDEERGKLHVRYHLRNSAKFDLRNWLPN